LIRPETILITQEDNPLKLKTSSLIIAATLLGAAVMPAHASNEAMLDLLKVLRDQGTITAENYELLANAAAADKEKNEATTAEVKAEVKEATKDMPKITTKGKIKIASADGNWEFQPIGRVMWDYISTDEDGSGTDDFTGTELRRARLGFQGRIYDWGYKFEGDFAKDDTAIKDAYVSYGTKFGDNKLVVKLGQSHIPFGLNTAISSKYMSFMDRPLFADTNISPARQSGAMVRLTADDYKWSINAGYTIGSIDDGSSDKDDTGDTFALRGSFVPYMADKNHLIQIGAGYMNVSDDSDDFRFRQRLVSHKDRTRHINTETISGYDGSDAFTLDAMGVYGSFHAMAEYLDYTAEFDSANDVDITAFAVEAGYFLTGESLKWKKGYTTGITPKSKYGAWQIAARFENLDVDGDTTDTTDEVDKWSVGVNYYPTQNTRLMLNYDHVTDLTKNDADADFDPSSLKFRAQAYW